METWKQVNKTSPTILKDEFGNIKIFYLSLFIFSIFLCIIFNFPNKSDCIMQYVVLVKI